jgi:hypothetical protein
MTLCWSGGRRVQWSRIEKRAWSCQSDAVADRASTHLWLYHDSKRSRCWLCANSSRTQRPGEMEERVFVSHSGQEVKLLRAKMN